METKLSTNTIAGIIVDPTSQREVLEKIKSYISHPSDFYHIVSLNPEIITIAQSDADYKEVLNRAQIRINDGIGIVLAAKILRMPAGTRFTGTDLMKTVLEGALNVPLRVLLIGGKANLANKIAECYSQSRTQLSVKGISGFADIQNIQKSEQEQLESIVADYMPQIIFASFGSPAQEKWFWANRDTFRGIIGIGVGGAFDFIGNEVARAPTLLRKIGLEWLFRLLVQPWRWRRQLRLLEFCGLVFKQMLTKQSKI